MGVAPVQKSSMRNDNNTYPIIFIGMHRSGTSMLTSFLSSMGLNTGWSRGNDEAYFFHKQNLFIEKVCNCGWDNPKPILELDDCPQKKKMVVGQLRSQLGWPNSALFFGHMGCIPANSINNIKGPWGWKDPRNTFTASICQELFPQARFVHIYRNGVDVAASLRERELSTPPKLDSVYSSPRVCKLRGGFNLWEEYIAQAFAIGQAVGGGGILHIRYEDFLSNPHPILNSIVEFCGLEKNVALLNEVASRANPSRAFSFKRDPELMEFYSKVKGALWMKKLGYDSV